MELRPDSEPRPVHLLARHRYLDELVEGRRVLVLGSADSELAERLEGLGARRALLVHPDEAVVERSRSQTRSRVADFEAWPLHEIDVRDGHYDVVLIDDLAAVEAPAETLERAGRALARRGVLVACAPNAESAHGLAPAGGSPAAPLGYYELHGLLAAAFPHVRLVAQCPLVGYVLADLASNDPEPPITFDASLLPDGSEDAEFYLAFCSREPFEPDPFVLVQVPLEWTAAGASGRPAPHRPGHAAELEAARAELTRLRQLEGELRSQADLATGEARALKLEMDKRAVVMANLENERNDAREKASVEHNRVVEAKLAFEAERKRHLTLAKELEMARGLQKLATGDQERLRELRERISELEAAAAERQLRPAELEVELAEAERARARAAELEGELGAERQGRLEAEARAAEAWRKAESAEELRARLESERASWARTATRRDELDRVQEEEVSKLEQALAERGRQLASLTAELERREDLLRRAAADLADAVAAERGGREGVEGTDGELAAARSRIAVLEGEVVAARARAAELEDELAALADRSARLSGDFAQADAARSLVQSQLEEAVEQADGAGLEVAELRARLEEAERRLATGADEAGEDEAAAALRLEIARLEGEALGQSFRTGDLERQLEDALDRAGRLAFVDERLAECAERMEAAERECESLRAALEGTGGAGALPEATEPVGPPELEAVGRELDALRAELAAALGERDARGAELVRLEELESERRTAEEALERVVDGLGLASSDAAVLADVLAERDERIEVLEARLATERRRAEDASRPPGVSGAALAQADEGEPPFGFELVRQLDSARRVVAALEADKRRLAAELDLRETEGRELEAGLRQLRSELSSLTAQTDGVRGARREVAERATSLETSLAAERRRVAELTETVGRLEAELAGRR